MTTVIATVTTVVVTVTTAATVIALATVIAGVIQILAYQVVLMHLIVTIVVITRVVVRTVVMPTVVYQTKIRKVGLTMKILINGNVEILNIGSVVERLRGDTCVLDININDSERAPDELRALFEDVTEVKVVRTDLDDIEHSAVFTDYTLIDKIQRKIGDETDITTVSLARAVQAGTGSENITGETNA